MIKEINTWKGGHVSSDETLKWISKQHGKSWLRKQKVYCKEVDRKREELDLEFQRQHEKA